MIWYWLVFLSLMGFAFIEQFTKLSKKTAKKICLLYTFLFIFLSTIRWNQTLGDWEGYYQIFNWEDINSLGQVFNIAYWPFEPIYYLAMRMINLLTSSYSVVLFFMASVASLCFYKAAVYLNESTLHKSIGINDQRSTIIATYFAFWATSCATVFVVRTNMAVAICLISIKYIEEKKLWKFIAMVVFAAMFHFVAVVFFIAYPVYYKKFNVKRLLELFGVAVIVGIVGLQRIIPLIGLLGGRYAEKIASYNVNRADDFGYLSYSTVFLTIRAMANTFLLIIIFLYIRNYMKMDSRFNGLFNMYVIGAFIQALTIGYNMEFARVAVFFVNLQFFLLPYIFKINKNYSNKFFYFSGFSVFMAVKMYSLLASSPAYGQFTTIFTR